MAIPQPAPHPSTAAHAELLYNSGARFVLLNPQSPGGKRPVKGMRWKTGPRVKPDKVGRHIDSGKKVGIVPASIGCAGLDQDSGDTSAAQQTANAVAPADYLILPSLKRGRNHIYLFKNDGWPTSWPNGKWQLKGGDAAGEIKCKEGEYLVIHGGVEALATLADWADDCLTKSGGPVKADYKPFWPPGKPAMQAATGWDESNRHNNLKRLLPIYIREGRDLNELRNDALASGLPEDEVDALIAWAKEKIGKEASASAFACAQHFAGEGQFLWLSQSDSGGETGCWLRPDGPVWIKEGGLESAHLRMAEIVQAATGQPASVRKRNEALTFARDWRACWQRQFNQADYLLPCGNQLIDLRTSEPDKTLPIPLFTMRAGAEPTGNTAPQALDDWLQFLNDAAPGDSYEQRRDAVAMLRRYLGYALTGDTRIHKMLLIEGPGGTGKSVLLQVIRAALGDFAAVLPGQKVMANRNDAHEEFKAELQDKRALIIDEVTASSKWNDEFLKGVSAGGMVSARRLYSARFEFRAKTKIILAGNNLPLRGLDDGMRRRIILLQFLNQPDKADTRLLAQFTAPGVLGAILADLIEQAKIVLAALDAGEADPLYIPAHVEDAANAYVEAGMPDELWIDENIEDNANSILSTGMNSELRSRLNGAGFNKYEADRIIRKIGHSTKHRPRSGGKALRGIRGKALQRPDLMAFPNPFA